MTKTHNITLKRKEEPAFPEEGKAKTHARGLIAHNHTYTGNVRLTTAPDIACRHPEHKNHDANHALNPMDADDKTTKKVNEEGAIVEETL